MGASKWAYDPERCDGQPCPGDCDRCTRWQHDEWLEDESTDADIISKAKVLAAIRERYNEICKEGAGFDEEQVGFLAGLEDAEDIIEALTSAAAEKNDMP